VWRNKTRLSRIVPLRETPDDRRNNLPEGALPQIDQLVWGLTTDVADHLSCYGQAGYQFAVSQTYGDDERNAVKADVGLRCAW
jgi:hypothetical protein